MTTQAPENSGKSIIEDVSQGGLEFEQHHEEAASERPTIPSSKSTDKLSSPKAKSACEKL